MKQFIIIKENLNNNWVLGNIDVEIIYLIASGDLGNRCGPDNRIYTVLFQETQHFNSLIL